MAKMRVYAKETNERLRQLAEPCDCQVLTTQDHWYGIDPIHYRRRYYRLWCRQIVNALLDCELEEKKLVFPWKTRAQFERATPAKWWFLGRERTTTQPAITLGDGSQVYLY
ncbi:hypothetical protein [Aeoliella mucimassa]|uniref:hypothetical protein n=1 Tax=Aeoliella mucimassa TaxID=2527972 RepID=UPI00119CCA0A|nr:hypothetical protein [Aeoliella mucimassa]